LPQAHLRDLHPRLSRFVRASEPRAADDILGDVWLAVASMLLPLAMFQLMARGMELNIALCAIVLACLAGGVSAVGAPATAEQFPGEGRLSGLALGVTMATAIFGGLTPFLAELFIKMTGWQAVPGAMIAAVALLVLPVLLRMPETRPPPAPLLLQGDRAEKHG